MRKRRNSPRIALVMGVLLTATLAVQPAWAHHIDGLKASVTSADPTTHKVNIAVTMYTSTNSLTVVYPNGGTLGLITVFNIPAINWGDGATLPGATINPAVAVGPPHVYRGVFSHTYSSNTPRSIKVASTCCANYAGSALTGNRIPLFPSLTFITPNHFSILTNQAAVIFPSQAPVASQMGLTALAAILVGVGGLGLWRSQRAAQPAA